MARRDMRTSPTEKVDRGRPIRFITTDLLLLRSLAHADAGSFPLVRCVRSRFRAIYKLTFSRKNLRRRNLLLEVELLVIDASSVKHHVGRIPSVLHDECAEKSSG